MSIIKKEGKSIVLFSATWCGACKGAKALFENLKGDFETQVLDVDAHADFTNINKVKSLPTVIIFEDGVETERLVGTSNIITKLNK